MEDIYEVLFLCNIQENQARARWIILQKKQSLPLSESEILSVYRNEFYAIDEPSYFQNKARYRKQKYENSCFKNLLGKVCVEQDDDNPDW